MTRVIGWSMCHLVHLSNDCRKVLLSEFLAGTYASRVPVSMDRISTPVITSGVAQSPGVFLMAGVPRGLNSLPQL